MSIWLGLLFGLMIFDSVRLSSRITRLEEVVNQLSDEIRKSSASQIRMDRR